MCVEPFKLLIQHVFTNRHDLHLRNQVNSLFVGLEATWVAESADWSSIDWYRYWSITFNMADRLLGLRIFFNKSSSKKVCFFGFFKEPERCRKEAFEDYLRRIVVFQRARKVLLGVRQEPGGGRKREDVMWEEELLKDKERRVRSIKWHLNEQTSKTEAD